jgi:RNA polymerase sigma-70 factor (ECF subfamily)
VRNALLLERLSSAGQSSGDELDLKALYDQSWRDLCRFLAAKFGAGPPEPEDVAQGAFLKLVELPNRKHITNPRALLYRTAINIMLDNKRMLLRRRRIVESTAPALEDDVGAHCDPEVELLGKEGLAVLERTVINLPPRHRAYFLANRLENLSYAEIARRTGASLSCVRKIVEEALAVCHAAVAESAEPDYRGLSRERGIATQRRD